MRSDKRLGLDIVMTAKSENPAIVLARPERQEP